ncbi:xylitol oxidase [Nocardioides alpinus]|uniref:FAD-binding protein n=1 Tax=Nocardioides alpinus TaxID=748909 RepID=A0A1I0VPK0_9ACTN|nr:FAD-binding protein [Nocardioides alpinus]PKH37375.1 FAD-binding protein [Nocardioides alpinus]SFA77927.1 xylitol oxidase [Nocardioides alpinus]
MSTPDHSRRTNWAGNLTYGARELVRPGSVAELREVVATAAAAGHRVRALGSRHSFSRVADTDGVHVSTRDLGLSVELEDGPEGPVAVVPGAMTYAEVAPVLQARGRALHNLGSLPHISVAGACATGTHGSGDHLGSLATAVVAIEIVTASGDLVRIDSGHPDFGGAVVSLGALGVVTRLWLRTEPTYEVRQRVWADLPADEVAEQLPEVLASGTGVSVFTNLADPDRVSSVWVKERLDRPGALAPCLASRASADRELHPVPGVDPAAASPQQGVPGPWHERLPHFRASHLPSVGEELQSELFLPRAAAPDLVPTMIGIRDAVAPALLVHEIRSVAADDLWLSPVRGRDSVVAHFTWRPDPALVMPALRAVEDALAPWAPRAHWGKITATPALRAPEGAYDLAAFRELGSRLDPDGVFRNDLLEA